MNYTINLAHVLLNVKYTMNTYTMNLLTTISLAQLEVVGYPFGVFE